MNASIARLAQQAKRRLGKASRGAVALEFAIVAPVLVLIILGSVEVGLAIQEQTVVQNATREAVRAASLGGTEAQVDAAAIASLGTDTGVTVTATCTTLSGLSCDLGVAGGMATVTINVAYNGITGIIPSLTHTTISASSTMRIEG